MSDKSLKSKAINIKGKKYVLVSDRVAYFNETYPNGSIETCYTLDKDTYVVTAVVTPDCDKPTRRFTDHSQAVIGDGMVNKTAALENASTSAVGRALAYMGIGVIDSIASVDEINKATSSTGQRVATDKQIKWIKDTAAREYNLDNDEEINKTILAVLTIPAEKVPMSKVKDAVDTLVTDAKLTKAQYLDEAAPKTINLEEYPY
jgi:hypothetical protein